MYEYSVLLTTLTYGGGHFISPEGSASQDAKESYEAGDIFGFWPIILAIHIVHLS